MVPPPVMVPAKAAVMPGLITAILAVPGRVTAPVSVRLLPATAVLSKVNSVVAVEAFTTFPITWLVAVRSVVLLPTVSVPVPAGPLGTGTVVLLDAKRIPPA